MNNNPSFCSRDSFPYFTLSDEGFKKKLLNLSLGKLFLFKEKTCNEPREAFSEWTYETNYFMRMKKIWALK